MNDNKLKEYVKIGGIVGGIVLSSTSLVNHRNDTPKQYGCAIRLVKDLV